MRVSPFTVAEESLGMSSAARGLGGMERTAAPKGPNSFDSGAASKPALNTQPFNNSRIQAQNVAQNSSTAVSQKQADAVQQTRKQTLITDNSDFKANQYLEARKSEVMSVLGSPATAAMGSMSPPELAKQRSDVATQKAMTMGVNPDLVQNSIQGQLYA